LTFSTQTTPSRTSSATCRFAFIFFMALCTTPRTDSFDTPADTQLAHHRHQAPPQRSWNKVCLAHTFWVW
jgi:hypothetical protein